MNNAPGFTRRGPGIRTRPPEKLGDGGRIGLSGDRVGVSGV
ncbi:hypothetical protein QWI29_09695 [Mycolicibacterium neoaurum]|nr:hypothetical protein [Mycolicibacterium neoaurum]MDO3400301.1 hypothetical protein [Mycolicibacterium neoaurum]